MTQEYIRYLFTYNQYNGNFYRSISRNNKHKVGDIAGHLRTDGYMEIKIDGKIYLTHRLVWFYVWGKFPENNIDHINGNPSDNRLCNLREATQSENVMNSKSPITSKNKFRGTSLTKSNKWCAAITVNYKRIHLGLYTTQEEAHLVYKAAAEQYHKDFSYFERP